MKLPYKEPDIDLIWLTKADIITTSGGGDNGIDKDPGTNDGEWT